jgi:pyridinium-3,5-bisthiocarboxylic acid mononucleotide nickel chelatase
MPPMTVQQIGTGAGARDLPGMPNVVRLVVGEGGGGEPQENLASEPAVLLETNVDDLDPRVWPAVLTALMSAGAADAWLTPILMKKGRPAHTLSVLAGRDDLDRMRDLVVRHTSTLGVRESEVAKRPLARDVLFVVVDGQRIAVKRGFLSDGTVANAQPEWDDVEAAATALGLAPREVLTRAIAAAQELR